MAIYAPIYEIFVSHQGEGSKTGVPCVFIRFAGCSKHCSFCDTKNAQSTANSFWLDTNSILHTVQETIGQDSIKQVVITGGEPFENEGALYQLIDALLSNGYDVAIETSGLSEEYLECLTDNDLRIVYDILDDFPSVWLTLSPKEKAPAPIFFTRADEIKLLIGNDPWTDDYLDYDFMYEVGLDKITLQPIWSAKYDKVLTQDRERCVRLSKQYGLRVSFQMHKYIGIE